MSQTMAAAVYGASRTTVCLWVKAYRQEGEAGLVSKPKGRPKGGKLTAKQIASIKKSVLGKNPEQLRLPGLLWTRELVGFLIERRFGIRLSRWTVGRHLKEWGLTPQKLCRQQVFGGCGRVANTAVVRQPLGSQRGCRWSWFIGSCDL